MPRKKTERRVVKTKNEQPVATIPDILTIQCDCDGEHLEDVFRLPRQVYHGIDERTGLKFTTIDRTRVRCKRCSQHAIKVQKR